MAGVASPPSPAPAGPAGPLRALLGADLDRPVRLAYGGVLLLGVLAVAASAALALGWRAGDVADGFLTRAPIPLGPLLWPGALAFAALFFALEKHGFVFHWREQSTKISLDEIALFLGVLVLPPGHVVLGVAGSSLLNQWIHRRGAAKTAFNVAQYSAAAAAAALAASLLHRSGVDAPWSGIAAPIVFSVTTGLLVSVLFGAMQRTSPLKVYRTRFGSLSLVGASLGTSLGLVAWALYQLSPLAVLAALPVFLYLRRFGRLSEWADDELKTHKLLASVSAEVAGRADLDAVAERILVACHSLLDCGEAQLTILEPEPARTWRRGFSPGLAGHGGITTPLHDAAGRAIGHLTAFPGPGQRGYAEREHHLLRTVAANAASAAANARALAALEEANRDLMASEGRYRHLFETAHAQVHVLDEEGRLLDMNPAAREALGPAPRPGLPTLDELLAPADPAQASLFALVREKGEVRGVEAHLRGAPAGSEMCVLVDAKVLEAPGQPTRYVCFSRDITPLKTLERDLREANAGQKETIRRLENMNRELEEFTLWTTHDMREPLRSIGTIAQFLHEDVGRIPPEEARDMARRIHEGAQRLKERVKALHAFSRIVQQDDEFDDVDLQCVVEEVVTSMEAAARERDARILLPPRRFPVVRAQPHRIHQVLANLVENALKYGRSGAPLVEVGFEETADGWRVFVKDDGPGIPAQYHDRIFQLFQRGPDTGGEGGSGAGLAIVKRIVDQHGGRVWVESEPGHGACFSFTLPRRVQPSAAGAALATMVRRRG